MNDDFAIYKLIKEKINDIDYFILYKFFWFLDVILSDNYTGVIKILAEFLSGDNNNFSIYVVADGYIYISGLFDNSFFGYFRNIFSGRFRN
jgi:hypothetical protein